MKSIIILILILVSFIACNRRNELNYIAFNVSKDVMIDSLRNATVLLDKMDFGNGAACFVVEGKLHYSKKEFSFDIVEMPKENTLITPIIEPLNQPDSKRLFNLIHFINQNGINKGMGKRADGVFYFEYKQNIFNSQNNYNDSRFIIYISEDKDTLAKISNPQIILDRYKNIFLVAPDTYQDKKLPIDKESIMKRAKESREKSMQLKN